MSHLGGGGSKKCRKSVTYFLNGPLGIVGWAPESLRCIDIQRGQVRKKEEYQYYDLGWDRLDCLLAKLGWNQDVESQISSLCWKSKKKLPMAFEIITSSKSNFSKVRLG